MGYRIILVQNEEYRKTLHKSVTFKTSIDNFNNFIQESAKVHFPRKYVNSNRIKSVKYKMYLVKDWEKGDESRMVRDKLGRLVKEKPLFGKWSILDEHEYQIEETFYVFGYHPVYERKNLRFIMGLMMKNIQDQKMSKSIVVIQNKLLIYNEDQFDMVLCKCPSDCRRLYNVLMTTATSMNYKRIIFMGEANQHLTNELYKMIMEETGWDYRKVLRTTTSPTNHK